MFAWLQISSPNLYKVNIAIQNNINNFHEDYQDQAFTMTTKTCHIFFKDWRGKDVYDREVRGPYIYGKASL